MSQSSIASTLTKAYEGQIADGVSLNVRSGRNNSGSEIAYGLAVQFDAGTGTGTDPLSFKLPTSSGPLLGVLVHSHFESPRSTGVAASTGIGNIVDRGDVYVKAQATIAVGDPVYVRYAGTGVVGGFHNASVSGETRVLSGAKWMEAGSSGDILKIALNLS